MRTLLTSTVVALLLAGGLSSCSEKEPEPKMPPTTEASSEPTQEQTEEPETPEAFVERWITEFDRVSDTGDPAPFLALAEDCARCEELANRMKALVEAGGHNTGGDYTISKMRQSTCGKSKLTCVLVDVDVAPGTTETADGTITKFAGGPSILDVTLVSVDGEWRVRDYALAPR